MCDNEIELKLSDALGLKQEDHLKPIKGAEMPEDLNGKDRWTIGNHETEKHPIKRLKRKSINEFDMDILSELNIKIEFINIEFDCDVHSSKEKCSAELIFTNCKFNDRFLLSGIKFTSITIENGHFNLKNKTFCNISVESLKLIHYYSLGHGVCISELGDFKISLCKSKIINEFNIECGKIYIKGAIFENRCKFSSKKEASSEEQLSFYGCIFKDINLNHIDTGKYRRYEDPTREFPNSTFEQCRFRSNIIIEKNFNNLSFDTCIFRANFISRDIIVENDFNNIKKCTFFGGVDFSNATFIKRVFLKNNTFKNTADFSNVHFHDDVYFDNSIFCHVNFINAQADKILSLQEVSIKGFIKISNSLLRNIDYVNMTNIKLDFRFDDIENQIEDKTIENYKYYRDSYRTLKDFSIKKENLIDAQIYKKYELYFYEKEMEQSRPKKLYYTEYMLLRFYRYTSEHHTDLLRIWHNLLIIIGNFGFLSAIILIGFNCYHLKFCNYNVYNLMEIYNIYIKYFISIYTCQILGINITLFIIFIIICLVCLSGLLHKIVRYIIIILSYIITIFIFNLSPKYIIPAISIFTDKRSLLDPLSVIGGLYAIFFALIAYSLIKTARKNSIVPN